MAAGCSSGIHIRLKQIHRCSSSSPACVYMLPMLSPYSYAAPLSLRSSLAVQLISCDNMQMFEMITAIRWSHASPYSMNAANPIMESWNRTKHIKPRLSHNISNPHPVPSLQDLVIAFPLCPLSTAWVIFLSVQICVSYLLRLS